MTRNVKGIASALARKVKTHHEQQNGWFLTQVMGFYNVFYPACWNSKGRLWEQHHRISWIHFRDSILQKSSSQA
jgi:hypothetical protein